MKTETVSYCFALSKEKLWWVYAMTKRGDEMRELYHYGILGMKWGIRRYQNKDGTLTPEGRRRLGLDKYDADHDTDILLKKGTKASRVVNTGSYYEYAEPMLGGSEQAAQKYINDVLSKEKGYERKYVSIDDVKNSGRANGKDFYLSWFTDGGIAPNDALLTMYELKKDVRVASGKQVVDALLDEVGSMKVEELLRKNYSIRSLTLNYTNDKELFNRVNKRFVDKGYDAIEDINDLSSDMPIIVLNSSKSLGSPTLIQTGREAIADILKKQHAKQQ